MTETTLALVVALQAFLWDPPARPHVEAKRANSLVDSVVDGYLRWRRTTPVVLGSKDSMQTQDRRKNIVLVGCGQLGSRHLQALGQLEYAATIHVVDPSEESRARARVRFDEIRQAEDDLRLEFKSSCSALEGAVDLAIIATTSHVRLDAFKQLLASVKLKNIVFEKFLFSRESDYIEAEDLVTSLEGGAWVNCPRRMYPVYRKLKAQLPVHRPVKYRVAGSNWGLTCNSIHFLDHLAYLSGESIVNCSIDAGTASVIDSRRSGYVEFLGELSGEFSGGSTISLKAEPAERELLITIQNEDFELKIDERARRYEYLNRLTGETETSDFERPNQSELSHIFTQDILSSGNCDLPTFQESQAPHLALLRGFSSLHEQLVGPLDGPLGIT